MRLLFILMLAIAPLLGQTAVVEGKVTEIGSGRPVRKAEVLLRGLTESGNPPEADNYSVETDAEGRFRIQGIIPGRYEAKPSRAGFLTQLLGRPDAAGTFARLNLKAGERATLELRLIATGAISGRTLNLNGDAVPGASVETLQYSYPIRDPGAPGTSSGEVPADARKRLVSLETTMSNDRGEFRIFGLAPGRYYLRVLQRTPRNACDSGTVDPNSGEDIVVANHFRFVSAEKFEFSGGPVTAFRGCDGLPRKSPSQSMLGFGQTYYPSTYEFAQAAPIDVTAGGDVANMDIRLRMEGVYSIRIMKPAFFGNEPFSVEIRRRGDPDPLSADISVHEDSIVLHNVLPGSYMIGSSTQDDSQYAYEPVEVVDRDIDVSLKFGPSKAITGVVQANGKLTVPFSGMSVEFDPDNAESPISTTPVNSDGTFTAYVLPEAYTLVRLRIVTAYIKSVKLGDRELTGPHIDFARESGPLKILFGVDGGTVEGTVIDANGQPAASEITLIPSTSDPVWAGRLKVADADENGAFTIPAVAPGEYKLFAWQDVERNAPLDPEFRKAYESQGVVVKIAPNQRVAIQLKPIAAR